VFSASTSGTSDFYEQTKQELFFHCLSLGLAPNYAIQIFFHFSIRDCRSKFLSLLILACWQRGRGYVNK
jgi:hypothetical protein